MEEIRSLVLATRNGVPVHLRDIATVEDSHEDPDYLVSVDGQPGVRMYVYKQAGCQYGRGVGRALEGSRPDHKSFPNIPSREDPR